MEMSGGSVDLQYDTNYATAHSIEWGPAFTDNQTGVIDDITGLVDDVGGETVRTDVGDDGYALLARIEFVPIRQDQAAADQVADQVPVDEVGHSIGPHSLGLTLADDQLELVGVGAVGSELGDSPATELYAVVYDIDDNDMVDFGDFSYFAPAFALATGGSEPPYTWWADFDRTGTVDFGDFSYFVPNFGLGKPSASIVFPSNFPSAWADQAPPSDGPASAPATTPISTGDVPLGTVAGSVFTGEAATPIEPAAKRPADNGQPEPVIASGGSTKSLPLASSVSFVIEERTAIPVRTVRAPFVAATFQEAPFQSRRLPFEAVDLLMQSEPWAPRQIRSTTMRSEQHGLEATRPLEALPQTPLHAADMVTVSPFSDREFLSPLSRSLEVDDNEQDSGPLKATFGSELLDLIAESQVKSSFRPR